MEKYIIEIENKNQELSKTLEELNANKLMIVEGKKDQGLMKSLEELQAAKVIVDEKNQQLEAITEEKLIEYEELLKVLETQEKTLLVKTSVDSC